MVDPRRPYRDLFLISFLILFLELACIRWFGSTVVFLTFFTNIVLLATFLGMSVGLMTAGRRRDFTRWVLPMLLVSSAVAMYTANEYRLNQHVRVEVGAQRESPQVVYFGTEYRASDPTAFAIPIELVGGVFFALIAVTFVGLGQSMGRAFDAIPNRVAAYTVDVLGSLSGIVLFAASSWLMLPPHAWFLLAIAILLYLARPWTVWQVGSALATVFLVAVSAYGAGQRGEVFWSPYYKITYQPRTMAIDVNGISHQAMVDVNHAGTAYWLPHLLARDAGRPPFRDVMIIGAGSGNDVSAAVLSGARSIDAVEIDPMINQIGRWEHPNKPYDFWPVHVHLDDGRSFVRRTQRKYDLITYSLVDSLVLHSGYSSLRLESFLFTRQAFEDVRAKLKPGGVFAVYNHFRQGWILGRLKTLAAEVFGVEPLIFTLPHRDVVRAEEWSGQDFSLLMAGVPDASGHVPALDAIRAKLAETGNFWAHEVPANNQSLEGGGYRKDPPPPAPHGRWQQIALTPVEVDAKLNRLPQDDWPFLYLRGRTIPWQPAGTGVLVIALLSIVILLAFTWPVWFGRRDGEDGPRRRVNGQMFFLGAGFMLLETKGVVHMALLFGSTWIVNSIVFFAILVMILIANLYVLAVKPKKLWPYYAMLGVALLVNVLVPMDTFLSLPGAWKTIGSCAVVFVPVFFAGVIFATSFGRSTQPDADFGWNVAGIIVGGLSENLSLVLGFSTLLVVAIAYYALSFVLQRRRDYFPEPPAPVAVSS